VDPDIEERLEALERDEDAAATAWEAAQEVGALLSVMLVQRVSELGSHQRGAVLWWTML
jgi:hypothetical protein